MKKMIFAGGATLALAGLMLLGLHGFVTPASAAKPAAPAHAGQVPVYQVDPNWPQMPNGWVIGQAAAVAIDQQDNVWILQRYRTVMPGFKAAPPVLEFDNSGKFIQAWGGPKDGAPYNWPGSEHGLGIDWKGNVWIGCEGRMNCGHILEFKPDGTFVRQIGKPNMPRSLQDKENFVGPTDITFNQKTNEIFVGDTGEGAARVVVLDYDTGKFKREWGGSGVAPVEREEGDSKVPFEKRPENDVDTNHDPVQLQEAHRIRISNDGLVYVNDGPQKRFEVFTVDGKFVAKVYVGKGIRPQSVVPVDHTNSDMNATKWAQAYTPVALEQMINHHETSSGLALSSDPENRYLYVYERSRSKALIYDRKSLKLIGEFGDGPGFAPGQFYIMHDLRADSHNNVFISEVNIGSRVQKFVLVGFYTPLNKAENDTLVSQNR